MRDPNWVALTDAQRGQLVAIWLLAADRDGVIPASPCLIQKLCYMDTEPDLQLLMEHGFIEPDANVTPPRRQRDQPEKSRGEKSREDKKPIATKKAVSPKKTTLPDDWLPNATHEQIAVREGVSLPQCLEEFRDYEASNGRKFLDWDAVFRTWLRKAKDFKRSTPGGAIDEGARDANRAAEARKRASTNALEKHEAEEAAADAKAQELRDFFETMTAGEKADIETEAKKRARVIQPNGKLTAMALRGCYSAVLVERQTGR